MSEGRIQVYGSVGIPNPNSALYSWMFEVKNEPQETGAQECLAYFITTSTISTATATPPTSSEATTSTFDADALTLTGQNLYISVVGMEDHNSFVLDGTIGNNCHEAHTQCVNDDPTTNSPTTTSPDNGELLRHDSSAFC